MKNERLLNALGQVDESFVIEAAPGKKNNKKIKYHKWAKLGAIAASFLLVFGMVTTVEANTGMVSNLLAPLFGGAQTELVDSIGVPVDVSATADGYTLTVDAIIGDRYNVAIVYTLTRDDGEPLPEKLYFEGWNTAITDKGGRSGSLIHVDDEENPSKAHYIETWSFESPVIGRYVTASFSNLMIYNGEDEDTFLAEGPWELEYTLCYKDTTKKVPVKNLVVKDSYNNEYTIKKIMVSAIGVYMDFDMNKEVEGIVGDFTVSMLLKDGTEVTLDGSYGEGLKGEGGRYKGDYQAAYNIPISFDDMEALIICGTTYQLDFSE